MSEVNIGIYLLERLRDDFPEPENRRHNLTISEMGRPEIGVATEDGFEQIRFEPEDFLGGASPSALYDEVLDALCS